MSQPLDEAKALLESLKGSDLTTMIPYFLQLVIAQAKFIDKLIEHQGVLVESVRNLAVRVQALEDAEHRSRPG